MSSKKQPALQSDILKQKKISNQLNEYRQVINENTGNNFGKFTLNSVKKKQKSIKLKQT